MSAQGPVPPAAAAGKPLRALIVALVVIGAAALGYVMGHRAGEVHELLFAAPSEARRVAFVREEPCADRICQTLWIGNTREDAEQVASLTAGTVRCEEIAWAKDGFRVGFVINGYQLRIFDGPSRKAVRTVNLIEPDGTPTSHFVRGVTFSQNGAAVTFDECPRGHSGCKSGLSAVR
jgi:hypothetical protein